MKKAIFSTNPITGKEYYHGMQEVKEGKKMIYIAKKELNKEKNGVEVYFCVYPLNGTRENLKKRGFRWNHKKSCWYAKQNADTLAMATLEEYKEIARQTGETVKETGKNTPEEKKATKKADKIDLLNLGKNAPSLCGAELSKAIREDLKLRGVSGVSVRARWVTYDTGITVTIKATAADIASVEELKKRYSFSSFSCDAQNYHGVYDGNRWIYSNTWETMTDEEKEAAYDSAVRYKLKKVSDFSTHYNERKDCPELATGFYKKCLAVFKIANQWNYDRSDSMTDYFDVGYYLDIDIKKPEDFQPRETMTEEEKAAYDEEKRQEEEERAAALAKWEQERKEAEEAQKKYEEQRKKDRDLILSNLKVEDLPEEKRLYISDLVGGIGKECNLEELENEIAENPHYQDALICRKVTFSSEEAYKAFTNYLLDDFDFLAGKGGTASEDVRLENVENAFYRLNEDQRQDVKLFMNDCVAIYLNNELMLVCNPEGYNYSHYTYKPTNKTRFFDATEETERQRKESEEKQPFYFPEKIEKQVEAIHEGQEITVYKCDGWILNSIYGGSGTVAAIKPGNYAQHTGVYIDLKQGNKVKSVFVRDNNDCLIYEGIKPTLPDSITRRKVSANMYEMLNYDELFQAVLKYYGERGEKPIIDTIQR